MSDQLTRLSLASVRLDVPLTGLHSYIQERLQPTERLNFVVKLTELVQGKTRSRQATPPRVPTPTYLALITHDQTAPPTRALLLLHQVQQKVEFRAFLPLDPRENVKFALSSEREFSIDISGVSYLFNIDSGSGCSASTFDVLDASAPPLEDSEAYAASSSSVMWTIVSALGQIVQELETLEGRKRAALAHSHPDDLIPEEEEEGEMLSPAMALDTSASESMPSGMDSPDSLSTIRLATATSSIGSSTPSLDYLFSWTRNYDQKKWDEVLIVDLAKMGGASTSSAEAAAAAASGAASPLTSAFQSPLLQSQTSGEEDADASGGGGGGNWRRRKNQSMRERWIQSRMKSRESEYTVQEKIRVVIGTYNVDQKLIPPEDLMSYLHLDDDINPDIVAVGLQEVDMSATALLLEQTEALENWDRIFLQVTQLVDGEYEIVGSSQLVGLYLVVMVKKEFVRSEIVADVKMQTVGCGALGSMGNKGGVALRFQFHESSMCFICSHLAAGHSAVQKRHQNMAYIENHTDFGCDPSLYSCKVHDVLFWFGDLNYRVDLTYEEMLDRIASGAIDQMWEHDQLRREKAARNVFVGYDEAPITFMPTYRFDAGTDRYDTSEKKRIPAWCDRIQWRSIRTSAGSVDPLLYISYPMFMVSDHKPVGGIYEVGVKKVVPEKYHLLYQEYIKKLDKVENDMRPELSIPALQAGVEFIDVQYGIPQEKEITFRNVGQVICEFRFVPKAPGESFAQPWLKVTPSRGMIIPEESVQIKFTVLVDRRSTPILNETLRLDDILILRLKNGGDHFISLNGNYLPSCFGSSISTLVGLRRGLLEPNPECAPGQKLLIPKELWNIIEYLRENALGEPGLFLETGTDEEVDAVREMLDRGQDLHTNFHGSNHSMAQALIALLKSLEEPVMPTKFHQMSVLLGNTPNRKVATIYQEFLMMIPPEHFNCFQYLCAFLRELLKEEFVLENELSMDQLSVIFSRVIFRPRVDQGRESEDEEKGKINFLRKFLDYQEEWNDPDTALLVRQVD